MGVEPQEDGFAQLIAALRAGTLSAESQRNLTQHLLRMRMRFQDGPLTTGGRVQGKIERIQALAGELQQEISKSYDEIQSLTSPEAVEMRAQLEQLAARARDVPHLMERDQNELNDLALACLEMVGLISEALACLDRGDHSEAADRLEQIGVAADRLE